MLGRKPSSDEQRLIRALVARAPRLVLPENWSDHLRIQDMNDGGMGSLLLSLSGVVEEDRAFGEMVAELQFTDADGILVIASLNVDSRGKLFELDVWKTDFSALIRIPDPLPPM
jgi:hypothetical protein